MDLMNIDGVHVGRSCGTQALHAWLALTQGGVQASLVVFTAANQQKNEGPDNGIIAFLTKQKEY
jgi:hypothetical protein